jgi:fibronectin-binding autotransporter adhesin
MADRYWVGGTGTWNTTSTTNWSASSGGASGASVPTTADNVFFDQAGTYTVTVNGALACLDITVSAGTVTFSGGGLPSLTVAGSMSLLATTTWSAQTTFTFTATTTGKTVTASNPFSVSAFNFNGVGGGWTLGSAISLGNASFTVTAGSVDSANYSITCNQLVFQGSSVRSLILGSSTVTLTGTLTNVIVAGTITNLTFNAGTSQINITSGLLSGISSGGLTFYNIAFTGTTAGTHAITGSNTFNNLAFTAPSSAGVSSVTFNAQQTINGTLSTTGTAGNRRVFFASATYGISVDLVVNSAPSLTDADFRGIYVRGTAAPISGTRIGNRGECRNITFDAPKTVYWNLAGTQNWSANGWATTSTGAPSTDNFPLPQDTATFTNAGAMGTVTLDNAIGYLPNVDMSNRTTAGTISFSATQTVYGNWVFGTGITSSLATGTLTFSGGGTQTITSAGKTFTCGITIDTYGGTVQLADALNIGSQTLTVTNGTFTTAGYAVTASALSSSNSNVRTINLGASVVALSSTTGPIAFATTTNLTFNAGTSAITITVNTSGSGSIDFGGQTFYSVTYVNNINAAYFLTVNGANTFTNLTISFPNSGVPGVLFSANQTVTGTLDCSSASVLRRKLLQSDTIGTQRTLTVNSFLADNCDFRDIILAGAAAGTSPTRAGDCGNNTGITFPAAKTVYWNLAGAQNWNATAWATSSGGVPAVDNFPLAQDTAVFDNTGSVTGTITINAQWNIGNFDASSRTSAMTLSVNVSNSPVVYGNWTFGTGVTVASTSGTLTFAKNGTQTITSSGVQFGCNVTVNNPSGTFQLADALSLGSTRTLTLTTGTFDAVTYNVTTGLFTQSASGNTLKMGSGTWTLSGTGAVWNASSGAGISTIVGTSTIVLSDTSTTARTFAGANGYYNKLTIGGTTGTSTLTITGANTFGELASTKTVAHTITLPSSTTTTVGKWAVTGTVGNVVTLAPSTAVTAYTLSIAGPANTGIDYLSISYCTVATTSPGEFYVGVNSTNTAGNTRVIFTATPAPRTLYWVGGTGNWSSTTKWSTSSGGASGAAIPISLDAVVFDSASNATAYTATIDAGVTLARCASFTMAGPASGNVTFAGTVGIAFHGNVSFAATGITRTYTGDMQWAGNASYTFTTNGLTLGSQYTVNGIGSTWTLGSALNAGVGGFVVTYGTFDTSASNYSFTVGQLTSSNSNVRSLVFNGSTVTIIIPVGFGTATNLSFSAGTSTVIVSGSSPSFSGGGQTFYNVSFTGTASSAISITGANTFNNLSFTGRTTVGITPVTFSANQTISGTLTVSAGTASAYRNFLASDTLGTTRTLTCAAVSATDADFRDITIAGAAAPASGTRLGDAKGNSGITFPAAKTVYWAVNTANWGATGAGSWSATSGGAAANDQFPLAQDTAYIPFATPTSGSTITVNANYNIGTLEMSNRNGSALVTLATGSTTPAIYGNWINGTGTTLTGTVQITFAGRGSQTITSAGKTFTQRFDVSSPGGSVTLQDAFVSSATASSTLTLGTFDANGYNVTIGSFSSTNSNTRTIAIGSGTWTLSGTGTVWNNFTTTGLTATGTGTISLTSASAKTFSSGGVSYSGITLNQGGAGALTITGNNTFKTITNTYSATGATSITLGNTTQTLTNPWTATGASGNVLTVSGTSAAAPGTLIFSSSGTAANVDYLSISNVRAYDIFNEWYAGANSTNNGSLGWYFVAAGGTVYAATITETGTGTDSILARAVFNSSLSDTATGTDSISAGFLYLGTVSELATGSDSVLAQAIFRASLAESGLGSDTISAQSALGAAILESATLADTDLARLIARATLDETATGTDTDVGRISFPTSISETATGTDTDSATCTLRPSVSESATGTETVATRYIARPNIAETATGTDAVSARAAFRSAVSESATITDLISAIKGYFVYIVESATGTETVSPRYIARPNIAESATGTETVAPRYIARPNIAETATGTDTDAAKLTAAGTISETATGTEAITARATFKSNISESAVAQELVQAFFVAAAQVSELATGSDQVSALRALAAAVVEALTIYEGSYVANATFNTPGAGSWTVPAGVTSAIIELWGGGAGGFAGNAAGDGTGGGGGAYAKKLLTVTPGASLSYVVGSAGTAGTAFPVAALPTAGSASTYSTVSAGGGGIGGTGGTATGGDTNISGGSTAGVPGGTAGGPGGGSGGATYAAAGNAPGGGGAGGISSFFGGPGGAGANGRVQFSTLVGSPTALVNFVGRLQEAATAQDVVNAPGSTYNILMQELAQAQDALTTTAVFPVSLSETATGTQTNSAAFIPLATISESATITDAASAIQAFAARILETSAAADSVLVAPSIFNAIAVAAATAIDNFNPAGSIYNVTVPESATLSDSVIGAFLWNIIDDAQNVTWNLVNAAQPVTWAHVEASQASDWNIIPITGVLGSTWSSSAAGGGTAVLLNTSRSPDGYQFYAVNSYGVWTVQRFPIVGLFGAVSYLNNQYFVYSSPSVTPGSVLLRSTDALTWAPVTTLPSSAAQVTGMFANGSTIVAVYNGQTYVTTDNCATWTAGSAMPNALQGSIVGLNYGSGLYILCDGRRIFSSPDALTWTTRATITYSFGASGYRGTVAWNGSRFAVVARSSLASVAPAFRTSTNGTTWTTFTPPAPISSQAVAVLWDGAQFVFVCGGAGATPASFYSANSTLTTFTLLGSLPGFFYVPTASAQYLFGKFGSQYVIPGFASPNNGPFYTSPNFSTFNAVIPPLPTDAWGNIATDQAQTWGIIPQQ